jgi:gliding motility-associated-like protein
MTRYVHALFLLLFFPILTIKAQLCNGTLGAPIFIETFGAGTGAGAALPAGVTTYSYTSGWPVDGNYTISNTSNPAPQNPHWYTSKDHTGDPNGYMFVVNASYSPGEFYRYTVTGLCSNTTYVFSAWIANVNNFKTIAFCKDNDPPYVYSNVLFKVKNSVTGHTDSIATGNIAPDSTSMVWHQFGFTFSTGAGQSSVILSMVNNGKGGCGNDLVIDDISFRPCGPSTSIAAIPNKKFYCTGDSIVLAATIGAGYNNPVYQWQYSPIGSTTWVDIPGATSKDLILSPIVLNHQGQYRLILAESGNITLTKCRIITESITIKTAQSPSVDASASPASICKGENSTLTATGANLYIWNNFSSGATTVIKPLVTTVYSVTGTDTITGCTDKATVTVDVRPIPTNAVVTGPDSICSGNTATLKATAPGGTYNWYDAATGGILLYTGTTYQTPILNANKTYYVEVVSAAACGSVSRTPVTVVVHTTPTSPVVAGPDSICSGNIATLTATAPGGTYKWYETSTLGTPIYIGNIFHTPVLNTTTTYYVEVESNSACTSVSRTWVTVNVNTTPISPVITTPDSICAGFTTILTATAPGGTYKWYETTTGGTPVYTGDSFHTPVLNTTKTYYVEAETSSKCTSVSRTPVTVFVNTIPSSPVVTGPDTICQHTSATLTAIAPGGTYKWYETSTLGTAIYTGTVFHTPVLNDTKTYYVEVISGSKCVTNRRTPVTVNVSKVKAEFTATPSSGLAPLKVDFVNLSTNAVTYHWTLEDQLESTSKNITHIYSTEGQGATYEVILIAINSFGCADTAKTTIIVNPFSELIIPNVFTPNGDGINDIFHLKSLGLSFINAEVYDRWGLKLFSWNAPDGGWDGKAPSGENAADGTYFYIIKAKGVDGKEYKLNGGFTLLR